MGESTEPRGSGDLLRTPGFAWRGGLSIFVVFGWVSFPIVGLFFRAGDYNAYQNIAILITSLLVLRAISSSTWTVRWMKAA